MSHEIGIHDKQQGLSQAWHGKTEILPVIALATCFLSLWDVLKRPLYRIVNRGLANESAPVPTATCEVVTTDTSLPVGTGKVVDAKSYTLLTNARFLAIVQSTLDLLPGFIVTSVGSVCNRARIFVSLAIAEYYLQDGMQFSASFTAAGREFKSYLNFMSSHDKSCPFTVNMGTVCIVCNNTFNANLHDTRNGKLRISIKHTSGMSDQLADVPSIIAAYFTTQETFKKTMDALALIPISEVDARALFVGFLYAKEQLEDDATEADKVEMSGRRRNQADRLVELFKTGKGNAGANLADVFSAATDYYSHESAGGTDNAGRQVASSEFGHGQTMKAAMFALLQDDKKTAKTIETGARVIAGQTV